MDPTKSFRSRVLPAWLLAHRGRAVAILLVLLVLPYLALCYYNEPYWDDFGNAALAREKGGLGAVGHLYNTWTGRYTAAFFLTVLNPLTYGCVVGVRWFALALFGATWGVQALALRALTQEKMPWKAALGWSAAWLLGQLYTMPSVNSGFYWFASTVTYQVGTLLLLLAVAGGMQAGRSSEGRSRAGWYLLAALAVVAAAGSNELLLVLLVWLLGALTVAAWRRHDHEARWRWLGLLLLALAAGAVALLAPGNTARMAYEGKAVSPGLGRILGRAFSHTFTFITDPEHLTTLLVAPVLLAGLGYQTRRWRPAGLQVPLLLGAGVVLAGLFGCFLLLSRTWIGYPPVRSLNFLWFWLLTGWLLALWAALPAAGFPSPIRWGLAALRGPVLVYAALLVARSSAREPWRDLVENGPSWKAQNEARTRAIAEARARWQRSVVVEGFHDLRPRHVVVLGEPLTEDPAHDLNRALAAWYGVDSLRVRKTVIEGYDVHAH